ncbi:MAG: YlxR family protein [Chloroflexi bacterium]|nr:YlxR family protein [Chloroflexota bacterium]
MGKKKGKHIPQRTCVVTGETRPKRELVRIVRTPDDGVQVDPTGKLPGRGAYISDTPTAWEKATQPGALDRALKTRLTDADRARIRDYAIEHGKLDEH